MLSRFQGLDSGSCICVCVPYEMGRVKSIVWYSLVGIWHGYFVLGRLIRYARHACLRRKYASYCYMHGLGTWAGRKSMVWYFFYGRVYIN